MGVNPVKPKNNTVIAKLAVSDVNECLERVNINGGKVLFGPSYAETGQFYYGGFADIEGNQMWVTQN